MLHVMQGQQNYRVLKSTGDILPCTSHNKKKLIQLLETPINHPLLSGNYSLFASSTLVYHALSLMCWAFTKLVKRIFPVWQILKGAPVDSVVNCQQVRAPAVRSLTVIPTVQKICSRLFWWVCWLVLSHWWWVRLIPRATWSPSAGGTRNPSRKCRDLYQ